MKIFSSIASVACLLILPVLIESCCLSSSCGCGDEKHPSSFDIRDITMTAGYRGVDPNIPIRDSLRLKSLELHFNLDIENLAFEKVYKPTMAAFACDYVLATSKEMLINYSVTSDSELVIAGDTFAAGEELNSKFNISGLERMELPSSFYQSYAAINSDFDVDKSVTQILTVKFTFDDGRVFEFKTKRFKLAWEYSM